MPKPKFSASVSLITDDEIDNADIWPFARMYGIPAAKSIILKARRQCPEGTIPETVLEKLMTAHAAVSLPAAGSDLAMLDCEFTADPDHIS